MQETKKEKTDETMGQLLCVAEDIISYLDYPHHHNAEKVLEQKQSETDVEPAVMVLASGTERVMNALRGGLRTQTDILAQRLDRIRVAITGDG
jgi:hypothetical protein